MAWRGTVPPNPSGGSGGASPWRRARLGEGGGGAGARVGGRRMGPAQLRLNVGGQCRAMGVRRELACAGVMDRAKGVAWAGAGGERRKHWGFSQRSHKWEVAPPWIWEGRIEMAYGLCAQIHQM